MTKSKTIIMTIYGYKTILQISRHGFYLSAINSFMMLVLSLCTKSVEIIHFEGGEITSTFGVIPLYSSVLFHIAALFLFKIASAKISEANKGTLFSGNAKNSGKPDSEGDIDFAEQSYVKVLEPVGSGSNQWFMYWGIGLGTSTIGSMIGATSAVFAAVSAGTTLIMMSLTVDFFNFFLQPYVILCVAAGVSQFFTLVKIPAKGLVAIPSILQRSLDARWSQDLRKSLEWRLLKKKSLEPEYSATKGIPWKVKRRLRRKTPIYVRLPLKESIDMVAKHLSACDATILHKNTGQIIAEHGNTICWDARDAKKKIFVQVKEAEAGLSEISIDLRFPLIDRVLTYSTYLFLISFAVVAYRYEPFLGTIMGLFCILTIPLLVVWDFFEKDAIIRDLWHRFHSNGVLEEKQVYDTYRKHDTTEKSVDSLTWLVTKLDNLYRIVFGESIVQDRDFPFMPMYMFRDYWSTLHKYGKTAPFLLQRRKEGKEYDFADTSSRIQSEIQLKESEGCCDAIYEGTTVASKIKKPTDVLKNIGILGRPSSILGLGPWVSPIMIGMGILLFFVNFNTVGWVVSKISFLLVVGFGLWVILGTLLILFFENSSTLMYTPESTKILLLLGTFPLIAAVLNFLLSEGSYLLKGGMDLWALSAVLFGLGVAAHTSGKPFSRSLYLYTKKTEYFPYNRQEEAPYWLTANSYWVFRFVLQWLWEIALPPHRDYERLEVWVNADNGQLEWVVTDFHYRELWYKAPADSHEIIFWWDSNFHSFHPIIDKEAIQLFRELKRWPRIDHMHRKKLNQISDEVSKQHAADKVAKFFRGFEKLGAKKCARLPWTYWRYSFGAYPEEYPERWKKYAADHERHGAALLEEQF